MPGDSGVLEPAFLQPRNGMTISDRTQPHIRNHGSIPRMGWVKGQKMMAGIGCVLAKHHIVGHWRSMGPPNLKTAKRGGLLLFS